MPCRQCAYTAFGLAQLLAVPGQTALHFRLKIMLDGASAAIVLEKVDLKANTVKQEVKARFDRHAFGT